MIPDGRCQVIWPRSFAAVEISQPYANDRGEVVASRYRRRVSSGRSRLTLLRRDGGRVEEFHGTRKHETAATANFKIYTHVAALGAHGVPVTRLLQKHTKLRIFQSSDYFTSYTRLHNVSNKQIQLETAINLQLTGLGLRTTFPFTFGNAEAAANAGAKFERRIVDSEDLFTHTRVYTHPSYKQVTLFIVLNKQIFMIYA